MTSTRTLSEAEPTSSSHSGDEAYIGSQATISTGIKKQIFRMQEVTISSFQTVRANANVKKMRKGASEMKESGNSCVIDCTVVCVFLFLFGVIATLATVLNNNDLLPNGLEELRLGDNLTFTASLEESIFVEINVNAGEEVAIFMSNANASLDTTMTLFRRPGVVLAFNNDLASDNENSIIFFFAERSESLVLEINTLDIVGSPNFTLNSKLIDEEVAPDVLTRELLLAGDIFIGILTNITVGTTYDILAFDLTAFNEEPDTSIRIRNQDGSEILEVFQSTVTELTARVLFTPDTLGPFILEIREIVSENDLDLRVLVREVDTIFIEDILNEEASETFTLFDQVSTVLKFGLEANFLYRLTLDISLQDEDYVDYNTFTDVLEDGVVKRFNTNFTIPGVSFRVQNLETNEIIVRGRTDIEEVDRQKSFENEEVVNYVVEFDPVGDESTVVEIKTFSDIDVVLDISRWNLNYSFSDIDDIDLSLLFGEFTLTGERIALDQTEIDDFNLLVDENNLYETCNIDQVKHTIDDDTCEQGIVLYCRNEFFPNFDTQNATKSQFEQVCDCAEFLCASLPSGLNIGRRVQVFLNVFYAIFAMLAMLGMIIYAVAHTDLYIYGGFKYWVKRNKAFSTWTFSFFFLVASSIYFITQITLRREILLMEDIAQKFDLNRIPVPTDQLQYSYYDAIVEKLVDVYEEPPPEEIGEFFLNDAALEVVNEANSFEGLQAEVNINLVSIVFKDVLSVIVFLDISISWLSSTRTTQLNREKRAKQDRSFKTIVRTIEGTYCFALAIILIISLITDGQSYNVLPNVLTLLLSTIVVVIYSIGRYRLQIHFVKSRLAKERENAKLWQLIQNVGSVVIVANIGLIVVQLYSIINIKNFDEFVAAANDPVAQLMFLFKDICEFSGQAAIFLYLLKTYLKYRSALFSPPRHLSDAPGQSSNGVTHNERTFFMKQDLKTPDALRPEAESRESQVSEFEIPDNESDISKVL